MPKNQNLIILIFPSNKLAVFPALTYWYGRAYQRICYIFSLQSSAGPLATAEWVEGLDGRNEWKEHGSNGSDRWLPIALPSSSTELDIYFRFHLTAACAVLVMFVNNTDVPMSLIMWRLDFWTLRSIKIADFLFDGKLNHKFKTLLSHLRCHSIPSGYSQLSNLAVHESRAEGCACASLYSWH